MLQCSFLLTNRVLFNWYSDCLIVNRYLIVISRGCQVAAVCSLGLCLFCCPFPPTPPHPPVLHCPWRGRRASPLSITAPFKLPKGIGVSYPKAGIGRIWVLVVRIVSHPCFWSHSMTYIVWLSLLWGPLYFCSKLIILVSQVTTAPKDPLLGLRGFRISRKTGSSQTF